MNKTSERVKNELLLNFYWMEEEKMTLQELVSLWLSRRRGGVRVCS